MKLSQSMTNKAIAAEIIERRGLTADSLVGHIRRVVNDEMPWAGYRRMLNVSVEIVKQVTGQ